MSVELNESENAEIAALACQVAGKSLERSVLDWAAEEPTQ